MNTAKHKYIQIIEALENGQVVTELDRNGEIEGVLSLVKGNICIQYKNRFEACPVISDCLLHYINIEQFEEIQANQIRENTMGHVYLITHVSVNYYEIITVTGTTHIIGFPVENGVINRINKDKVIENHSSFGQALVAFAAYA